MFMLIPLLLFLSTQTQSKRYSDSEAGVSFSFPSTWEIVEHSQDYSMCSWFVTLRSGSEEINIGLTGNGFRAVAESEYFQYNGMWTLDGKPVHVVTGSSYRALEGEYLDPRGRSVTVTFAMIERVGKCSVRFITSSSAARKVLYSMAESFRFSQ